MSKQAAANISACYQIALFVERPPEDAHYHRANLRQW
jgi:hypothetical protein